ncbi:Transposon Ty3-G Gag-Pol polyprotein [Portunus trituberculatus]|uniref:Transposon Ty3-G Gag-Pol polyprotein n=1 Tax=Portunus trituberculatus TaxID=210409 RepID=A0A5B7JM62_PORTR|nr:Transposon Ty3-G Gag-Pol polyprotein [Portunus trituberculatus]
MEAIGVDAEKMPDQTVKGAGTDDFSHERGDHRLANSLALEKVSERLSHLGAEQRDELVHILQEFPQILQDTPTRTHLTQHDVALLEGAKPVKQYPYRLSPEKRELMRQEVKYLLDNGLARPSCSPWAAPCILVPKGDRSVRLCTGYMKLNIATVTDSFPMLRIDDLIDEVSSAEFLTKIDLLKGFC